MSAENELLEHILNAHGGLKNWEKFRELTARFDVSGELLKIKGFGTGLNDALVKINMHEQKASFPDLPGKELITTFESDRIATFDRYGDMVDQLPAAARSVKGQPLTTPWSLLQFAYFSAYATWNYLTAPFNFTRPDIHLELLTPWEENGETWQQLAVTFPEGFATHNRRQIYFFDASGLLRRHNYFPDALNGTPAVQIVSDYREFSGIKFPTNRKVYKLDEDGSFQTEPLLINLMFKEIELS